MTPFSTPLVPTSELRALAVGTSSMAAIARYELAHRARRRA